MDVKTTLKLHNDKAGYEVLLKDARIKMKETMAKKDYSANLNWTQVVSRLENDISSIQRQLDRG
jgi:hypothetical protein